MYSCTNCGKDIPSNRSDIPLSVFDIANEDSVNTFCEFCHPIAVESGSSAIDSDPLEITTECEHANYSSILYVRVLLYNPTKYQIPIHGTDPNVCFELEITGSKSQTVYYQQSVNYRTTNMKSESGMLIPPLSYLSKDFPWSYSDRTPLISDNIVVTKELQQNEPIDITIDLCLESPEINIPNKVIVSEVDVMSTIMSHSI